MLFSFYIAQELKVYKTPVDQDECLVRVRYLPTRLRLKPQIAVAREE